ncbi:MAG: hypothetical protein RDU89_06215 [bacterium]|nr:hypothetical protein [bacterium]
MMRRAVLDVSLSLLALMLAASPLLAAGEEPLPGLRQDLDRVRIAMRPSSAERLRLLAHLAEERAADALRFNNQGAKAMARWALAWTARLMEMVQLEARRGVERGEELGQAMEAVERATARAVAALSELEDSGRGDPVAVDLSQGTIARLSTGRRYETPPYPAFMQEILAAGGLAGYVRRQLGGG